MLQRRRRESRDPCSVCVCIVDPGTTALRVLVAEVRDGRAQVWGWSEVPAESAARPDRLAAACEEALVQAERMAQERAGHWLMADQMIVGLPSAVLRGRAWPVTQQRSRPERPVEESELAGLLARALRLAGHHLADGPDWRLVDSAIVAMSMDGHGVSDPVGFKGREMSASVFAALAPADQIDAWCVAARQLELSTLTLTAAPLVLAAGTTAPHSVLIDVGGETTDLALCRAGCPLALESLPAGGTELTRALVQKWGLAPGRAEQVKKLYTGGGLPADAGTQIREVIMPALRDWLAAIENALIRLSPDEPLPQRLVLLGGGSALPEIGEAMRTLAWSDRLQFARYPEVGRLLPADIPDVVNGTDRGRAAGDVTALALAAWAGRQTHAPARPARVLAGLCRAAA